MSVVGLRLKHDLEGKPSIDFETIQKKKMIATTRSFEKMYDDFNTVKERVGTFAISCAEKLRKQKSHCNLIMVFLHTNGFRKDLPQYGRNIDIKTDYPTNSSIDINKYAQIGLKAIFKAGFHYKKAGVIVMGITPENVKQLSFFNDENPKHAPIMGIVDRLNKS